ncbi:MAG: quinone-dependent dihydroorotate dehydrogenase [Deltaproteobacteria bacterium]|nr:quinone-dependent dihydroorotate dehydrogenase [Deltaproteobacteria bacterium]
MYSLLRRTLFKLDAERAHSLAVGAARIAQSTMPGLLAWRRRYRSDRLRQSLWFREFETPFGLAAGFDKNAELIDFWRAYGFGFTEVGSVTARPSPGNPKPRAFRLAGDRALINRMGLNNDGADEVAERLARRRVHRDFPVGINLAKTHDPEIFGDAAIEDFRQSFRLLAPLADYVALNVSCPNTREGKTFEDPDAFDTLLAAVFAERESLSLSVPVLVKLSPPLPAPSPISGHVLELVELALARGVAGFIACNTASDRLGLRADVGRLEAIGKGGLSGRPVKERSTRLIRHLYRRLQGEVPIIGVGGVSSTADAIDKLAAGANLVELYTGLVYQGPGLASRMARELDRYLDDHGMTHVRELIGSRCDQD